VIDKTNSQDIKMLIDLTLARVEILKLKADDYNWQCHTDNDAKEKIEDALLLIDKLTHDFRIDDIQGENTELTIRDKFAMSALNGLLSYQAGQCTKVDAEFAYNQADAMLEARK
jgi:hypothetical protein